MFILYAIPIGLIAGLLLGGRLEGLGRLRFRWGWVFALGLAVQLVLFSDFVADRIGPAGMPIYVTSTLVVALVVVANHLITGMPIAAAGAFSNLAAIVANGGYMPASESALSELGKVVKGTYTNSSFVENPNLPWLTDIFAMPAWLPAANVYSIGDVLIGLGVAVVIAAAMRARPIAAPPSAGATRSSGAQPGAA